MQWVSINPIFLLLSNFEVAAVDGHNHATRTIYHVLWQRVHSSVEMINRETIKIYPGAHTGHLWAWNVGTAAICFLWWVQSSTFGLQDFRALRTGVPKQLHITNLLHLISTFPIVRSLGVQKTTTTSSWSAHGMKMAWFMHIGLYSEEISLVILTDISIYNRNICSSDVHFGFESYILLEIWSN